MQVIAFEIYISLTKTDLWCVFGACECCPFHGDSSAAASPLFVVIPTVCKVLLSFDSM